MGHVGSPSNRFDKTNLSLANDGYADWCEQMALAELIRNFRRVTYPWRIRNVNSQLPMFARASPYLLLKREAKASMCSEMGGSPSIPKSQSGLSTLQSWFSFQQVKPFWKPCGSRLFG
jgi:hypothetical protein